MEKLAFDLQRPTGSALVESVSGDRLVLTASVPSPPGSTIEATLAQDLPSFRIKVRGCRREGAGFRIEGTLVNPTRAQRERLLAPPVSRPG